MPRKSTVSSLMDTLRSSEQGQINKAALRASDYNYEQKLKADKEAGMLLRAKDNAQMWGDALDMPDPTSYLKEKIATGVEGGAPMTISLDALKHYQQGDKAKGDEVLRQSYRQALRRGVIDDTPDTRKLAGYTPTVDAKTAAEISKLEAETGKLTAETEGIPGKTAREARKEQREADRLALETRRVEATESGEARAVAKVKKETAEAADKRAMDKINAQRGIRQVDRIEEWVADQGGEDWIGSDAMGGWAAMSFIPGTDAYQLQSMVDKIDADMFMSNIQNLRGLGHLSNIEGAKAAAAIANLDPGTGYTIFMEQLGEVKGFLELGEYRADNGITITKNGEQKVDGVVIDPVTGNESREVSW